MDRRSRLGAAILDGHSVTGGRHGYGDGRANRLSVSIDLYDFGTPVNVQARRRPGDEVSRPVVSGPSPAALGRHRSGQTTEFAPRGDPRSYGTVTPSIGWGVLHLYLPRRSRAGRARSRSAAKRCTRRDRVAGVRRAPGRLHGAALGHKADLGVMALGPDLARLQRFQHELLGGPFDARVVVRIAHRAIAVHVDRRRRAGAARARGRHHRRCRGGAAPCRVAGAHGPLPGAAHPSRSCPARPRCASTR